MAIKNIKFSLPDSEHNYHELQLTENVDQTYNATSANPQSGTAVAQALLTVDALPLVEGSGKALVSVNGEWVEQEGFPWKENPVYGPITWDGDPTGKEIIHIGDEDFVKLSDILPDDITDLIGGRISYKTRGDNHTSIIREEDIGSYDNIYFISVILSEGIPFTCAVIVYEDTYIEGIEIFKGVWSIYSPRPNDPLQYLTLLASPAGEIHKIDPTYLPDNSVEMIIHGTFVESSSSSYLTDLDVSYEDAVQAYLNGRTVKVEFVWDNRTNFLYASDYYPNGNFKSLLKDVNPSSLIFTQINPYSSSATIIFGEYKLGKNRIVISWSSIEGLPSQSGQSGKYLRTNGTAASWEALEALPAVTTSDNDKVLAVVNGVWAKADLQTLIAAWEGGNF